MIPKKDEVVLTRVLNRVHGEDRLLLIYPNDLTEEEAMAQINDGLDLGSYEREFSKSMSHWLDRLGGNPGHMYVGFRKVVQP